MPSSVRLWLGTIACILVSLLAAFFVVFNSVFSDVFGVAERIGTYFYAGTAYLILGFVSGLASPTRPLRWTYILSVPPALALFLYTFSEPQNILIHAGFAVLVPLAAYAGIRLGARLRAKKTT